MPGRFSGEGSAICFDVVRTNPGLYFFVTVFVWSLNNRLEVGFCVDSKEIYATLIVESPAKLLPNALDP